MWALVKNGKLERLITTAVNVVIADGSTISNIRLLPRKQRIALGIFDYTETGSVGKYEKEVSRDFIVDEKSGMVTREIISEPKPIDLVKKIRISEISNKRLCVLREGIVWNNIPISTDSGDIDKYLLIANSANGFPSTDLVLFDKDNQRHVINKEQFEDLMNNLARHFYKTDNTADSHMAAIEQLDVVEDVINYNSTSGWPVNATQTDVL